MTDQTPSESPIKIELVPCSDRLFFLFGGFSGAMGMPLFEFYRAAQVMDCSKVFLRDLAQAWYQRGLPTVGPDVFAIRVFLKHMIEESGASQIRFVGNSMGGFAAILFCSLLETGEAIAFSPQTFICQEKRAQHKDQRWAAQINELAMTRSASDIYDLKSWISKHNPNTRARVYVSLADSLDMIHANELAEFQNIKIHSYDVGGHRLVRHLRDDGSLARILSE
jgi:hypothetical protein